MARRSFERILTRETADRRVFVTLSVVTTIQISLQGWALVLDHHIMFRIWQFTAAAVGSTTLAIESYKARRERIAR